MKFDPSKENIIKSVTMLGSGFAGGLIGSAVGRPSGPVGLGIAVLGVLGEEDHIVAAGIGMMTTGMNQSSEKAEEFHAMQATGQSETQEQRIDLAKDRGMAYLHTLKKKFYLDKLIQSKEENTADADYSEELPAKIEEVGDSDMAGLGYTDQAQATIAEMQRMWDQEARAMGIETNPGMLEILDHPVGNLDTAILDGMGNLDSAITESMGNLDYAVA